jgi:hypothetical protein
VEHPSFLFDVLGQSMGEQAVGDVVYHDVWPFTALDGMDRSESDPAEIGRGPQLFRKPFGK